MRTEEVEQPTPRDRGWTVGFAALLVLPLVVSALYLWFAVGSSYYPGSDWALFELHTRDVWHHLMFVGPYSRYGWNHPGPLLFYVLALPYKLSGSRSISMHITALIVNGTTIAAIAWVAFRRGRLPMVVATLVPVALLTHALGPDLLRNPWNPYLPVVPLLLLFLLCWSVAVGDLWMLPFAVAVASFETQLHVGLALPTFAFVGVAIVAVAVQGWRTPKPERGAWWRRLAKIAGVSFAVFFMLWLPVLYGTFIRKDGNLGNIIQFFQVSHATAGATKALQTLGLQWGLRPEWILGPRGSSIVGGQITDPRWYLALSVLLGVGATVIAVRRRSLATLWLAGFVTVGFVAAGIAVSHAVDILYPYIIRWTWVIGAALGILVLRGVWLAVAPERRARVLRWAVPITGVLLVAISAAETVDALNAGTPFALYQGGERTITRQVIEHLPPGPGTVLIDNAHNGSFPTPGIVLALEKHGIPSAVVPSQVVMYGYDRDVSHGPYRAAIVPVSGLLALTYTPKHGRRIAHYSRPQTAESRGGIRAYIRQTLTLPQSKARSIFLKALHAQLHHPAQVLDVYLVPVKQVLKLNSAHSNPRLVRPLR